ncbi:MAG: 3-dehydroquinate synthase [Tepidanaerobacter sp.]|jgi:3-dehydroquinate synthase|nr:3-dehydroquinate synthase [Tepidanaerobacter sp.]
MQTLQVNLKNKDYPVYIKRGIIKELGKSLRRLSSAKRVAIITDKNLSRIYGAQVLNVLNSAGFETDVIAIEPGEKSKTLATLADVFEGLVKSRITRRDIIIALGGGVVGDLGGFAASSFLRGMPYVQVPTSLIAQVDSSIGGKVAVDLPQGKNLVGSFYHPEAVFIDPDFLDTLDAREFSNGMAEVIKYGCIKDRQLFEELTGFDKNELLNNIETIIFKCLSIKKKFVEEDETDQGARMMLNFGHTLGHAIEKYYHYVKYSHGEAVAVGMYRVTKNSEDMGLTEPGTSQRLKEVLSKYGLPYEMPAGNAAEIVEVIAMDKKNKGDSIDIVLLNSIGDGFIKNINKDEIPRFFL